MATTTNFGWDTPDDTDLVKDGAAAIRTALNGVDTSFVDLKGGTTGQVLAKNSDTDLDFVWSADAAGMTNPMTTTGDVIYSSPDSTPVRLGVGSTGQVLTVAAGVPSWSTPAAGGGMTLLSTTTITGAPSTVTVSGISGSYQNLIINVTDFYGSVSSMKLRMTFNNDTASNYRTQNTTSTTPYDSGVIGYLEITEYITSASNANSLNVFVNDYTNAFNKNGTTNVAVVSSAVLNCSNTDWAYKTTSAITRFDITTSTGTITQGTIKVYGVN